MTAQKLIGDDGEVALPDRVAAKSPLTLLRWCILSVGRVDVAKEYHEVLFDGARQCQRCLRRRYLFLSL